jgi:hypothetical protein
MEQFAIGYQNVGGYAILPLPSPVPQDPRGLARRRTASLCVCACVSIERHQQVFLPYFCFLQTQSMSFAFQDCKHMALFYDDELQRDDEIIRFINGA